MIPVHDAIPIRTRPAVTFGLLLVLVGLGAAPGPRVLAGSITEPWWAVLFVQILAHRDWVHVGSNMLAVWVFGPVLEDRMGHVRYLGFAALCAVTGAAAAMTLPVPSAAFAGLTGLAAGLVAAYSLQFPKSRAVIPLPVLIGFELADVPAWFVSAFWTAIQLVDLRPPRVIAAGAIAGAIGLLIARRPERLHPDWWSPMGQMTGEPATGDRTGTRGHGPGRAVR